MARATSKQTQPQPPPSLRVPREEAATRLEKQIDDGEKLTTITPLSPQELGSLKSDGKIWSDYNRGLLNQIFTTSAVAEEYSAYGGGALRINPSFQELVSSFRENIRTALTRLRSIHRRLDLFDAPTSPMIAKGSKALSNESNSIFLVHGHNNEAKETVARFLERLALDVIILHEQPDKGRTVIEKFEHHANVGYAVVLVTGDDIGADRETPENLQPRGRQNVVLELGYFIGALGRARVCALKEDGVEVPSDLSGVLYLPLDPAGAWKLRLAGEIKSAGINLDMNRAC